MTNKNELRISFFLWIFTIFDYLMGSWQFCFYKRFIFRCCIRFRVSSLRMPGRVAPPDFIRSVNPISTRRRRGGDRLCPPNNTGTPRIFRPSYCPSLPIGVFSNIFLKFVQFRKIEILDDMNHTLNENWAYLIYNLRPNKFEYLGWVNLFMGIK